MNFHALFEKVLHDWEMSLPKGRHKIFRMYDAVEDGPANQKVVWGISTLKSELQAVADYLADPAIKIEYWKEIQGRAVLPRPTDPKAPTPRHGTIVQD